MPCRYSIYILLGFWLTIVIIQTSRTFCLQLTTQSPIIKLSWKLGRQESISCIRKVMVSGLISQDMLEKKFQLKGLNPHLVTWQSVHDLYTALVVFATSHTPQHYLVENCSCCQDQGVPCLPNKPCTVSDHSQEHETAHLEQESWVMSFFNLITHSS